MKNVLHDFTIPIATRQPEKPEGLMMFPKTAVWFSIVVMVLVSVLAGYLFWAKATFSWPFLP